MPTPNIAAALPSTTFIPASLLHGAPLPISVPNNSNVALPSLVRAVDFSGFNTLSTLISVSGILGGDNLEVDLIVEDPETGISTPAPLGLYNIFTITTDGDYANTLYLPAYYAATPANIMPFFQNLVNLVHNGASGAISVTALKFWLSNA